MNSPSIPALNAAAMVLSQTNLYDELPGSRENVRHITALIIDRECRLPELLRYTIGAWTTLRNLGFDSEPQDELYQLLADLEQPGFKKGED